MTLVEEQKAAHAIATAVVVHLKGWAIAAPEGHWGVYLVHACGARVFVTTARHNARGRVVFSGCAPKHKSGHTDGWGWKWNAERKTCESIKVEISVAVSREPKAIARELERRLFPGFLEAWRGAAAKVDSEDTATDDMVATARRIATVLEVSTDQNESFRRPKRGDGVRLYVNEVERFVVHAAYDSVDGHHPVGVEMRLRDVPPELAVEFVQRLARAKDAEASANARLHDEDASAGAVASEAESAEVSANDVEDEGAEVEEHAPPSAVASRRLRG